MDQTQQPVPTTPAPTNVEPARPRRTFLPAADVYRLSDAVVIEVDLPGADADAIDLQAENGVLRLSAAVAPRPEPATRRIHEYDVGDYERSFRLGEEVDVEAISAEYDRGVLTVTLPRPDASRPRKIPVS